jgi:hypothetical protein
MGSHSFTTCGGGAELYTILLLDSESSKLLCQHRSLFDISHKLELTICGLRISRRKAVEIQSIFLLLLCSIIYCSGERLRVCRTHLRIHNIRAARAYVRRVCYDSSNVWDRQTHTQSFSQAIYNTIRNCWTEMLARSLGHIIILVHFRSKR